MKKSTVTGVLHISTCGTVKITCGEIKVPCEIVTVTSGIVIGYKILKFSNVSINIFHVANFPNLSTKTGTYTCDR